MAGTMKWVVRLEAVFEDGRASIISEIGAVERSDLETLRGRAFGLTLAEGKTLIALLQYAKIRFMPLLILIAFVVIAGHKGRITIQEQGKFRAFSARLLSMRRVFGHAAVVCLTIQNAASCML